METQNNMARCKPDQRAGKNGRGVKKNRQRDVKREGRGNERRPGESERDRGMEEQR